MGWPIFLVCIAATVSLFWQGYAPLAWVALAVTVVQFWSFGVMYNLSQAQNVERARNLRANSADAGWSEDETEAIIAASMLPKDADLVPDWLAWLNLLVSLAGIGLLIAAIVFWLT